MNEYQHRYRIENRARIKKQRRGFYLANRDRLCSKQTEYRNMNPLKSRHRPGYQLKRRYKMNLDDYQKILSAQGGVCAICKRPPDSRGLFVDHDHSCCPSDLCCGKCNRGLLCNNCNWAISALESNPDWAKNAEAYLRRVK